ncbi:MAG: hypothetical protein HC801_12855, partial [Nitrospira sp.]|nr:hypothetical protein [Nitrospira sp.]
MGPIGARITKTSLSLFDRFCEWLKKEFCFDSGSQSFEDAVIQAIVTHVYLEWIHPFGDGNGRTGRLLEFYILLRAGNPDISSHILSNFYNETRAEYYRQHPFYVSVVPTRIDPDFQLVQGFHPEGLFNDANWNNPEMESLLSAARTASDPAALKTIYGQMQELIQRDGGVIISYFRPLIVAKRSV